MRDVCVCIHVSVLVCTDFFVFVMEKCLYFPCLCWSTVSSQKHGLPLKQPHHLAFFFFLGDLLKLAAKIHSHNLQQKAGNLCIAVAVASGSDSPNGLFKLFFFSPCVEETDAETWDPKSQGQQIWPIVKVTMTS